MGQGIVLMVVGMSSVFLLLLLLVGLLQLSARYFSSWPLDEEPSEVLVAHTNNEELELIASALAAAERSRV